MDPSMGWGVPGFAEFTGFAAALALAPPFYIAALTRHFNNSTLNADADQPTGTSSSADKADERFEGVEGRPTA